MSILNKNKNNGLSDSASFYTDCCAAYHEKAKELNAISKDMIFIPELLPLGQKAVLAFLQDGFYQMQFGNNPHVYYYFIFSLSVDAGIVLADKWHKDYENIDQYLSKIIEEGPVDDANALLQTEFPSSVSENQGNPFFNELFKVWNEMHEPYWKLSDPRQYTFNAMLAGYQLGVTMILEKYGY